jgi:hypothetical protein
MQVTRQMAKLLGKIVPEGCQRVVGLGEVLPHLSHVGADDTSVLAGAGVSPGRPFAGVSAGALCPVMGSRVWAWHNLHNTATRQLSASMALPAAKPVLKIFT